MEIPEERRKVLRAAKLSKIEQFIAIAGGSVLLLISILPYVPFVAVLVTPFSGQLFTAETYEMSKGLLPANLAVTTAGSAIVLLIFGINGYRLASARVAGNEIAAQLEENTIEPSAQAEEGAASEELIENAAKEVERSDPTAKDDTQKPVWRKDGWEFYRVTAVPTYILRKLLTASGVGTLPDTLGAVEFAFRKEGGPSTWHFKIRGRKGTVALVQQRGENRGKSYISHRDYGPPPQ